MDDESHDAQKVTALQKLRSAYRDKYPEADRSLRGWLKTAVRLDKENKLDLNHSDPQQVIEVVNKEGDHHHSGNHGRWKSRWLRGQNFSSQDR